MNILKCAFLLPAYMLFPYVTFPQEMTGGETDNDQGITGSTTTITSDMLGVSSASRVDQLLQGRIPGALISSENGSPGAKSTIRIRGANSIYSLNEPLYVLNGVWMEYDYDLSHLNINDIESIEVLRSPSLTALYGSRGSNGVILITTKDGTQLPEGETSYAINYLGGFQTQARRIDLLDGREFAVYANDYAEYAGSTKPFQEIGSVPNTDWQEEVSRIAPVNQVDIAVRGNRNKINYSFSGNYFNQEGVLRESGINKYISRVNLEGTLFNGLSIGLKSNLSLLSYQNSTLDLWKMIKRSFPVVAVHNPDGSYTDRSYTSEPFYNPLAHINQKNDHSLKTEILPEFYIRYEPFSGLTIKSALSTHATWLNHKFSVSDKLSFADWSEERTRSSLFNVFHESTIAYEKKIKSHHIELIGGYNQHNSNRESTTITKTEDHHGGSSVGIYQHSQESSIKMRRKAAYGQLNYSFKKKYFLTLTGRWELTSFFKEKNAFIPAAGVAWQLDREPFMKDSKIFDHFKLRASWGIGRSMQMLPFSYFQVMNVSPNAGAADAMPAPVLTYETTRMYDGGLEIGLVGGRVDVDITYYSKRTEDLLNRIAVPHNSGFSTVLTNLGQLQNRGVELAVNSVIIEKPDFKWEMSFNISANRSKLLNLGEYEYLILSPTGRLQVGHTIPVFTGFKYLGVWNDQAEIDAYGNDYNNPGDIRFADINGDRQIGSEDITVIGDPEPDFFGGLTNRLTYKKFRLDIHLQCVYGNDIFSELSSLGYYGVPYFNSLEVVKNRWTPDNTGTDIPRIGSPYINHYSSAWLQDGSFLRLKNVKLSYNLPGNEQTRINDIWLYLEGSNLLLLSNYVGFNPEGQSNQANPILADFRNVEYPDARTFVAGVQIHF